jgi:hypothetical protein
MIKLFLGLLILTNASFSIAARKDSADQQEKDDFNLYLKDIEGINEITPHAMAHFWDSTTKQPLYPPSKKLTRSSEYTFDMDKYNQNYTVFGGDWKWDDVKAFIKNNADDIVQKKTPSSNIYTVTFDTSSVPTEHITSIQCNNKKCKKRLGHIRGLDVFFNKNLDDTDTTQQERVEKINKKFNNEIRSTTNSLGDSKKIKVVVEKASPTQLKTSYPTVF